MPSNAQHQFDLDRARMLKWAAKNRILFQFPDATFNDVASSMIDESCKTFSEPAWSKTVFSALDILQKNPSLQNKIHVVEIKRDSIPKSEVTKDLDGLTYLILSYAVIEKKSWVQEPTQRPCFKNTSVESDEEVTKKSIQLPSPIMITKALSPLPTRNNPERWNFKTEFLDYLANKTTILRFSSELGFERSADGQFFMTQFLNEQVETLKKSHLPSLDFWLGEIAQRSHAGSYLKIMELVSNKRLEFGLGTIQNTQGHAFPFLSYKSQDGKYTYTSLIKLENCLQDFSYRYKRRIANIRTDFSTQADSFLFPGYTCQ